MDTSRPIPMPSPSVPPPSISGASPSISDTLGSVPATLTHAPAPQRRRLPLLVGFIAAAGVLGAGALAFSGRPAPPSAGAEASHDPAPSSGTALAPGPSAAPVVPAAPVAPAQTVRQVRVESDPPGASVAEGDTQLCTSTPCEVTWTDDAARAEHTLHLSKKGYKLAKVTVGPGDPKAQTKLEAMSFTAPPPVTPPPAVPGSGRPLYKKDI